MDWFLGIHALKLLKLPVSVVMVEANLQEPKQNSGGSRSVPEGSIRSLMYFEVGRVRVLRDNGKEPLRLVLELVTLTLPASHEHRIRSSSAQKTESGPKHDLSCGCTYLAPDSVLGSDQVGAHRAEEAGVGGAEDAVLVLRHDELGPAPPPPVPRHRQLAVLPPLPLLRAIPEGN